VQNFLGGGKKQKKKSFPLLGSFRQSNRISKGSGKKSEIPERRG